MDWSFQDGTMRYPYVRAVLKKSSVEATEWIVLDIEITAKMLLNRSCISCNCNGQTVCFYPERK